MRADIAAVIICDEVRKELTGKDFLIGVFSGGIAVPAYPSLLRAALWIEIEPQDLGTINCQLRVHTPSGNPPLEVSFDLEVTELGSAVFVMNSVPLSLEKDGDVIVEAKMGESPWRQVKRKSVTRQPVVPTQ